MGGAIQHWLGFQDKIGRAFMMNEDALKYPLADYLVNSGDVSINTIELEYPHPNFPNRLIDLTITTNNSVGRVKGEQMVNAFELKLAKTITRTENERKRIFNDLIRLHMANQYTTEKCYFIITGKSKAFQTDFHKFNLNGNEFYRKWFSFVKGEQVPFAVSTETDPTYKNIYVSFVSKYKKGFQGTTTLKLPTQIITTCEFVTPFTVRFVPYICGIWSVV